MAVEPQAPELPPTDSQTDPRRAIPEAPVLSGRERVGTLVLGFMVLGFAAYLIFDSRTDAALTSLVVLAAVLLVLGLIGHRLRSIKFKEAELRLGGILVEQAVRAQEEGEEERAEALADAASALDPRLDDYARLRTASDYEHEVLRTLGIGLGGTVTVVGRPQIGRGRDRLDAIVETRGRKIGVEVWAGTTRSYFRGKIHRLAEALSSAPGLVDGLLLVGDDAPAAVDRMVGHLSKKAGVPARWIRWRPGLEPSQQLIEAFEALLEEVERPPSDSADS